MRPCSLLDARVGLLGYGREGRATRAALGRLGHREGIIVLEDAPRPSDADMPWLSGAEAVDALGGIDVLVASPGVPPRHPVHAAARARGLVVTTATNLFLAECAHEDLPVTLVTGSKGKSTTSTLLHRALVAGGREAALVGNVGAPALDHLDDAIARRAHVVFELSSYQAAGLDRSAEIVVVTSLFPEHVDWHGTTEQYYRDKLRAAALQEPDALTLHDASSPELARRVPLGPARHEAFNAPGGVHFEAGWFRRGGERLFDDATTLLRGAHNRRNACGVIAACAALGVAPEAVRQALAGFGGLPHRLEVVGTFGGLLWVNDSISTAPEAAVAAIEAFAGQARTLIAGGQDRAQDFAGVARAVIAHGIEGVATLPPCGASLAASLRREAPGVVVLEAADLAEAVAWAALETPHGAAVVFSPAAPSYGTFRNFEERGERFAELVRALGS